VKSPLILLPLVSFVIYKSLRLWYNLSKWPMADSVTWWEKKTHKTPRKELAIAEQRLGGVLARVEEE